MATHFRVIKRHADDYIAIDYPDITDFGEALAGLRFQDLADGESITIVREVAPLSAPGRYRAYDRAVGRPA